MDAAAPHTLTKRVHWPLSVFLNLLLNNWFFPVSHQDRLLLLRFSDTQNLANNHEAAAAAALIAVQSDERAGG